MKVKYFLPSVVTTALPVFASAARRRRRTDSGFLAGVRFCPGTSPEAKRGSNGYATNCCYLVNGFCLRVPLLCSAVAGTSPPDATRLRTAAADAPPPTDPGRCPVPGKSRENTGKRSCPNAPKRSVPLLLAAHGLGSNRVTAAPDRVDLPALPGDAAPVPSSLADAGT